MRRVLSVLSVISLSAFGVAYGCGDDETTSATEGGDAGDDRTTVADTAPPVDGSGGDSSTASKKAKATLTATGLPDSGTPMGSIEIVDDGTQATVQISVSGATNGYHGVHIHAA